MQKTNFYEMHKKANAKMVSFAGFEMPIQYPAGIIAEHKSVREKCGVFDVSHMGEFIVKGPQALDFVQKVTVNDASKLKKGAVQYSAMCYNDGGIVDDLLVYCMNEKDHYMLVVNGANIEKDFNWLSQFSSEFDIEFTDISSQINLLAVQGPNARAIMQKLTSVDISEATLPYYHFTEGVLADVDMIISRTGYTGELGYEIYFKGDASVAEAVWEKLFAAGEEFDLAPVGLGARDTLRLEKGFALYGNDITAETNTIEAGLGWITKLDKGEFNGSDVIAKVKAENPPRRLVGFAVTADKFIARQGYKVFSGDNEIGIVTSGNLSPSLNIPIGMAYVAWDFKAPGTQLEIEARGKRFAAEVKKMPLI